MLFQNVLVEQFGGVKKGLGMVMFAFNLIPGIVSYYLMGEYGDSVIPFISQKLNLSPEYLPSKETLKYIALGVIYQPLILIMTVFSEQDLVDAISEKIYKKV